VSLAHLADSDRRNSRTVSLAHLADSDLRNSRTVSLAHLADSDLRNSRTVWVAHLALYGQTSFHQTQPLKLVIRKFQIPNTEVCKVKNLYSIFFNEKMVPLEHCHIDMGN
jgi:hypothetical protein